MFWMLLLAQAQADDYLAALPAPDPGFRRMVIEVPELSGSQERDRQIEVIVGKTVMADCNQTGFFGSLESHVVQGFGYTWYSVAFGLGGGQFKTAMGCGDQAPKEVFAKVDGEGFFRRYNSRAPLVVYVPEGFEVRYRVWSPAATTGHARPR